MRRLFQSIDSSGDGAITLQEFEKLVASPKLRFWMSQLELLAIVSLQIAVLEAVLTRLGTSLGL